MHGLPTAAIESLNIKYHSDNIVMATNLNIVIAKNKYLLCNIPITEDTVLRVQLTVCNHHSITKL